MRYETGQFFHSDLCGPMPMTFVDENSGYRNIYFLRQKSDAFDCFRNFERRIQNKFNRPMSVLRSDREREYVCGRMRDYMAQRGIQHQLSAPASPEQNGRAERENCTIMENVRAMLHAREVPLFLWNEAVSTAAYVLNRVPGSRNPDTTPMRCGLAGSPTWRIFEYLGWRHTCIFLNSSERNWIQSLDGEFLSGTRRTRLTTGCLIQLEGRSMSRGT